MLPEAGRDERPAVADPDRADHDDRVAGHTAGDEGQHLVGWAVEPLDVVRHDEDRPGGRHLHHQVEGGESGQERLRRRALLGTERAQECASLRGPEGVDGVEHGSEQLVQAGEGKLGLGLDAGRRQDGASRGPRLIGGRMQQRGLADARLTRDHDRGTFIGGPLDERPQEAEVVVPADEARCHSHRLNSRRRRPSAQYGPRRPSEAAPAPGPPR